MRTRALTMGQPVRRWLGGLAVLGLVCACVGWAYRLAEDAGVRSLREGTAHRLDVYGASLDSELRKYEYLPPVVAINREVHDLLAAPADAGLRDAVNRYLATVNASAAASAIYLMDPTGLTLAASNWDQPVSFVSRNFVYRPYFQDALRGVPGRFYGIGTVSREPGYYFAHGVAQDGRIAGVIAVKVSLDRLDSTWRHEGEKVLVVDGNGVIFLSSEPRWKFRTLRRLSDEAINQLERTRQYTEAGQLEPLGLRELRTLDNDTLIAQVDDAPPDTTRVGSMHYIVHGRQVPGTDWRLLVMSEMVPAQALARNSAAVTGLVLSLLAVLVLYWRQRRRSRAQAHASREALQRAYGELERKVEMRTEALRKANEQLHSEVTERKRAEETLKATLKDLVQTAKLAVLGQMSAGVTHELNQPLAALRTLSSNAAVLLERGRHEEAASNLRMIGQLTDNMGKITGQLKRFARKSTAELRPTPVGSVIADALFVLHQSKPGRSATVVQDLEPDCPAALCDANRLEQVLLNLLANALDAVHPVAAPQVRIELRCEGHHIRIGVHDNGLGVSAEVRPHLFEPFFTTKGQGQGLGLGLAISAHIVKEFGGTLHAESSPLGGTAFIVRLRAAVPTENSDRLRQAEDEHA